MENFRFLYFYEKILIHPFYRAFTLFFIAAAPAGKKLGPLDKS